MNPLLGISDRFELEGGLDHEPLECRRCEVCGVPELMLRDTYSRLVALCLELFLVLVAAVPRGDLDTAPDLVSQDVQLLNECNCDLLISAILVLTGAVKLVGLEVLTERLLFSLCPAIVDLIHSLECKAKRV